MHSLDTTSGACAKARRRNLYAARKEDLVVVVVVLARMVAPCVAAYSVPRCWCGHVVAAGRGGPNERGNGESRSGRRHVTGAGGAGGGSGSGGGASNRNRQGARSASGSGIGPSSDTARESGEGGAGNRRFQGAWLDTAGRNRGATGAVKIGRPRKGAWTTKQLIAQYGKEEYEFFVAFHVEKHVALAKHIAQWRRDFKTLRGEGAGFSFSARGRKGEARAASSR